MASFHLNLVSLKHSMANSCTLSDPVLYRFCSSKVFDIIASLAPSAAQGFFQRLFELKGIG